MNIPSDKQKTRTGAEPKDIRAVKPKMFSLPGSDRDPIRAYHLYAYKRPEQMKSDDCPFYLDHKVHQSGQFLKTLVQSSADGLQQIELTHENHG